MVCPSDHASFTVKQTDETDTNAECTLTRNDEILTYVARNLEPYRGFYSFMRAVPAIHEQRPAARILVVGADGVSYGRRPPKETSYREMYMQEWGNGFLTDFFCCGHSHQTC